MLSRNKENAVWEFLYAKMLIGKLSEPKHFLVIIARWIDVIAGCVGGHSLLSMGVIWQDR